MNIRSLIRSLISKRLSVVFIVGILALAGMFLLGSRMRTHAGPRHLTLTAEQNKTLADLEGQIKAVQDQAKQAIDLLQARGTGLIQAYAEAGGLKDAQIQIKKVGVGYEIEEVLKTEPETQPETK